MTTSQTPNLPAVVQPGAVPVAAGETSTSAIAMREKAAVEARYLYALAHPRQFDYARRRLLDACMRPAFAKAARYSKPVGNGSVQGFSIRFAEEARRCFGNMDVSAFLVFDDDERRIYRVIGTDLETNATEGVDVMVEKFIERRSPPKGSEVIGQRHNKSGEVVFKIRATEDDLIVKVNAQISKARRNTILSLIPADLLEECQAQVLETTKDVDAKDPAGARKALVDAFWEMGVTPDQLADFLGHPLEQINPAELHLLRTCYTAVRDGEATWSEVAEQMGAKKKNGDAPAAPASTAPARGSAALKEKLNQRAPAATAATETEEDLLAQDRELAAAEKKK